MAREQRRGHLDAGGCVVHERRDEARALHVRIERSPELRRHQQLAQTAKPVLENPVERGGGGQRALRAEADRVQHLLRREHRQRGARNALHEAPPARASGAVARSATARPPCAHRHHGSERRHAPRVLPVVWRHGARVWLERHHHTHLRALQPPACSAPRRGVAPVRRGQTRRVCVAQQPTGRCAPSASSWAWTACRGDCCGCGVAA